MHRTARLADGEGFHSALMPAARRRAVSLHYDPSSATPNRSPMRPTRSACWASTVSGNPVGYFLFSGEQHGFRKPANIQRCLDAELAFYAIEVFRTGLTF